MRNCIDCKHFGFSQGSPGYSEWTPGWEGSIECYKNHWSYDAYNDTLDTFRTKLHQARKCKDYKEDE